jgi:hypothetical protein
MVWRTEPVNPESGGHAMTLKYGFFYNGYELHCDPMKMMDGRFGAQVFICDDRGSERLERQFPALEYFATEKEAVDHAYAFGKRWVDDRG